MKLLAFLAGRRPAARREAEPAEEQPWPDFVPQPGEKKAGRKSFLAFRSPSRGGAPSPGGGGGGGGGASALPRASPNAKAPAATQAAGARARPRCQPKLHCAASAPPRGGAV